MMFIIVFPKFFTRPQKILDENSSPRNPRKAAREVRRARFRALLHEHAPFLLGWTPNDSGTSCNDHKFSLSKATPPPYNQNPEASEAAS